MKPKRRKRRKRGSPKVRIRETGYDAHGRARGEQRKKLEALGKENMTYREKRMARHMATCTGCSLCKKFR